MNQTTKFTNLQQAAFAQRAVAEGWKYWYGTCGYQATNSLYNSKKAQYPSHYGDARTDTYKQHIAEGRTVADCVGLIKAFFWTSNGETAAKYGTNSCPDKGANGMFNLCKTTGAIGTIPATPGLVVWNDGHIGISIDGVWAIEARGFNYGVVKTRIADRSWKKWGQLPASMIDYVDGEIETTPESVDPGSGDCPYAEPTANQKKGSKGEGVIWVQWMLEACGYSVGVRGIDGDFGSATLAAVEAFQRDHGLSVDGIVGKLTRAEQKNALASLPDDVDHTDAGDADQEEHQTDGYVPKGKIADLSKWQGAIDWTAAARELDFCILRAQYGHEQQDERYLENAAGCEAMGIPYGAYSYCLFDDEETAREEARFFVERIKGTNPKFLVLDLEPGGVKLQDVRAAVSAYIDELRKLGIERIGLYIAQIAYKLYNIDVDEADFMWLPSYGSNSGEPEMKPEYPYAMWQYTSNGHLGGVKGHVNLNKLTDESRMAWFRGED